MAKFTQANCDALASLSSEQHMEEDGTTHHCWFVRVTDENGLYYEFEDTVSASDASSATLKTNAFAHLMAEVKFKAPKVKTKKAPKDLLKESE